jgi:hypothetical protein
MSPAIFQHLTFGKSAETIVHPSLFAYLAEGNTFVTNFFFIFQHQTFKTIYVFVWELGKTFHFK